MENIISQKNETAKGKDMLKERGKFRSLSQITQFIEESYTGFKKLTSQKEIP